MKKKKLFCLMDELIKIKSRLSLITATPSKFMWSLMFWTYLFMCDCSKTVITP
jgi:hypothetical protein